MGYFKLQIFEVYITVSIAPLQAVMHKITEHRKTPLIKALHFDLADFILLI